jgi:putative mycofactocin binding protein MftB
VPARAAGAPVHPGTDPGFDTRRPYRLHPQVALRPEPFGALAYHYGNRRLVFLKSPAVVALVRSLADHPTLDAALDAAVARGEIAERQRPSYARAVASLVASGVVCPLPPAEAGSAR